MLIIIATLRRHREYNSFSRVELTISTRNPLSTLLDSTHTSIVDNNDNDINENSDDNNNNINEKIRLTPTQIR